MADLKVLIPKDTTIIKLTHPVTGEFLKCDCDGTEMTIEVYGTDSSKYRKIQADMARERERGGRRNQKLSPEQIDELITTQLAHATVSWNIEYDSEKPALTKDKVIEVLNKIRWMRDQVVEGVGDRSGFLQSQPNG